MDAIKIISDNFENLIRQIEILERNLELTETRALEWEQMHLDELTQRKDLQMRVEGLQAALQVQLEHSRKHQENAVADRMEKVAKEISHEDINHRKKWETEDAVKRDMHNAAVRESIEKQTKIMDAGLMLHAKTAANSNEQLDLIRRSVIAGEKQTLLMESISQSLIALSNRPGR